MKDKNMINYPISPATAKSRSCQSRQLSTRDTATRHSSDYIRGEGVPKTALSSISALYEPSFKRYPTFPSIYESKYQRDFRFIPWPTEKVKREYTAPPNYKNFKIGCSSYSDQFQNVQPIKTQIITPISQHRKHNPQPSIRNVQNYPDHVRWIWSDGNSKRQPLQARQPSSAEMQSKWRNSPQPRWHRWNSR